MITYPRAMPLGGIVSQSFEPRVIGFETPTNGGRVYSITAGETLWAMSMTLRDGDEDEVAEWRAFLASLRGAQRTFLAGDLTRPFPRAYPEGFGGLTRAGGGAFAGAASGWALNADRDVVDLSGQPAGLILGYGDYVMWRWATGGVQRRALARAIEPAVASAGGVIKVSIEPPLSTAVPGSAVADLAQPQCVMRLMTDQSQIGELDALHSAGGTIVAQQDLRP